MERPDLSREVVHFIRGETPDASFATLRKILSDRALIGGTGFIRGGYRCICFCEAPIAFVAEAMERRAETGIRYQPFGVVLPKSYVFARGARPVIYQPEAEYELLPEAIRWRHVRYEPDSEPPIDFTWEREWRIRADRLELEPQVARVVVPSEHFAGQLLVEHEREQHYKVSAYSQIMSQQLAEMYSEHFAWHVAPIEG